MPLSGHCVAVHMHVVDGEGGAIEDHVVTVLRPLCGSALNVSWSDRRNENARRDARGRWCRRVTGKGCMTGGQERHSLISRAERPRRAFDFVRGPGVRAGTDSRCGADEQEERAHAAQRSPVAGRSPEFWDVPLKPFADLAHGRGRGAVRQRGPRRIRHVPHRRRRRRAGVPPVARRRLPAVLLRRRRDGVRPGRWAPAAARAPDARVGATRRRPLTPRKTTTTFGR